MLVARIGEPAVGLQEHGGAKVFFAVPPVGGAGCGAAGAEDAFVETVELLTIGGRLTVFEALGLMYVSNDWDWDGGMRLRIEGEKREGEGTSARVTYIFSLGVAL